MSIRSYSNLIVLETIFDSIPPGNFDLDALVTSVFSPSVEIVEADCGTGLGTKVDVNYELEGRVELATGNVLSYNRILVLLSTGNYYTFIRELSSCISQGGVCQKCYHSSRQKDVIPNVGDYVVIQPEYVVGADAILSSAGKKTFTLSQSPELYDRAYVYYEGVLLPESSYTISGTTLTLSSALPRDGQLAVRYTTYIRAPFLFWLATTYSGSLLGIKELPYPALPIRKRLLTSLILTSVLESLVNKATSLKGIPDETLSYMEKIHDPLEKALFVIAIYAVYLNVN